MSTRLRWVIAGVICVTAIFLLQGVLGSTSWEEETRLLDGRVVVVQQKRRYEHVFTGDGVGSIAREAWLTVKLPETGGKKVEWNEPLHPLVLNIHGGKVYVVCTFPSGKEYLQSGRPRPPYVAFTYQEGAWRRIPFSKVPIEIYETNLLIEQRPPRGTTHITLSEKAAANADPQIGARMRRLDPTWALD
jgi:hypothetical protein